MPNTPSRGSTRRAVLYQLCRAGERFQVGDGPVPLRQIAVAIGRGDPKLTDAMAGQVWVDDPWMSSTHALVSPLERKGTDSSRGLASGMPSRWVIADVGSTNGVLVNGMPAQKAPLLHGDLIETGRTFWVYVEEQATDPILSEPVELGGIATWSPSYGRQLAELLPRVPGGEHVLVSGPAGSGKGFLARTIHVVSGRTGRFVHLDCRERRHKRLVVDLFGDENHTGRLRDAEGGTLFLENVEALPLEVQDRLIEALRKKGFAPEGRARTRTVSFTARVVAATALSVEDAFARHLLRQGLVDALGPLFVRIPALEQRLPDLGLLLDDFLARARGATAMGRDACRAVLRYPFKRNTHAMGRAIEAAAALAAVPDEKAPGGIGGQIELVHLPVDVVGPEMLKRLVMGGQQSVPENTSELTPMPGLRSQKSGAARGGSASGFEQEPTDPAQERLDQPQHRRPTPPHGSAAPTPGGADTGENAPVDPDAIVAALAAAHGNVSAAARALGRPRASVLRWMREFGIGRQ